MLKRSSKVIAGIDGCAGGWFCVTIHEQDEIRHRMAASMVELLNQIPAVERIFIDIPVGLSAHQIRTCDILGRSLLGSRRSSLFTTPVREAVYATDYREACQMNQLKTGRKISIQSWNICPMIRDVDGFIRSYPQYRDIFYESHPELLFQSLNKGTPLPSKHTKQGEVSRIELIESIHCGATRLMDEIRSAYPAKNLKLHDMLDALILALAAGQRHDIAIPEPPEIDSFGIRMAIRLIDDWQSL